MTKITQYTELKAGMKVKINDEIRTIIEYSGTGEQKLNELRDILIANDAELIEDNAKVVVSAEVAKILEKIDALRGTSFINWGAELHGIYCDLRLKDTIGTSQTWLNNLGLSSQDLLNIYENGWEVEKPKHDFEVGDVFKTESGFMYEVVADGDCEGRDPDSYYELSDIKNLKFEHKLVCKASDREDLRGEG